MSKREDQAYAAWVEEIKTTLPDADAVEAFEVFAGTDAGREIYRGNLREKDYYTRRNELHAAKQDLEEERRQLEQAQNELAEWFENEEPVREALMKERDELRKAAQKGTSDGPPNPVTGISPEEVALLRAKAQKVDALDKVLPSVLGDISRVTMDAMRNGYDIDPGEIMQYSIQNGVDPMRAYYTLTAPQREAKQVEALKAEKQKWFEEGRRAALSGDAPDHFKPSGPSIFDTLTAPEPEKGNTSVPLNSRARVADSVRQYLEGDYEA